MWLVPFRGRTLSGTYNQNFLWKHGNVYIMDNHRAAAWCWLKELEDNEVINIFHIDEHYDMLMSQMDQWLGQLPDLRGMSIKDYLSIDYPIPGSRAPIVRWDNYLSIFMERYGDHVDRFFAATHGIGDCPEKFGVTKVQPQHLLGNLAYELANPGRRWIVNIDLDYLYCGDQMADRKPMFSAGYIRSLFETVRVNNEAGRIAAVTICLTPDKEFTGGWRAAEQMCERACKILQVPFKLPN